jgi:hypothetical protein
MLVYMLVYMLVAEMLLLGTCGLGLGAGETVREREIYQELPLSFP